MAHVVGLSRRACGSDWGLAKCGFQFPTRNCFDSVLCNQQFVTWSPLEWKEKSRGNPPRSNIISNSKPFIFSKARQHDDLVLSASLSYLGFRFPPSCVKIASSWRALLEPPPTFPKHACWTHWKLSIACVILLWSATNDRKWMNGYSKVEQSPFRNHPLSAQASHIWIFLTVTPAEFEDQCIQKVKQRLNVIAMWQKCISFVH